MIIKESVSSATIAMISVLAAGVEAVQLSSPAPLMTTWPELAYSSLGGLVGGMTLIYAVRPNDVVDAAITLIFSAIVGFSIGPSFAHYLQAKFSFFTAGDALTNIPAGAAMGVAIPILFPILITIIASAKSKPQSVGEWLGKAAKAFWLQVKR